MPTLPYHIIATPAGALAAGVPRKTRRRSTAPPQYRRSPPTWIDGGKDRPSDAAGAAIDATTLALRHLDAKNFLHNGDATSFFEAAGGLIVRDSHRRQ